MCEGFTLLSQTRHEIIPVPAGIKNGMVLIIDDLGDYGSDCSAGDLIVMYKVQEHPDFVRAGNDAIITILLPQSKLMQENFVHIPTLYNGYQGVRIPPFTIPGSAIQFDKIGFYDPLTNKQGDLQIIVLPNPHPDIETVHHFKPAKTCKATKLCGSNNFYQTSSVDLAHKFYLIL